MSHLAFFAAHHFFCSFTDKTLNGYTLQVKSMVKQNKQRDFLVALMNNKSDFQIAKEQNWYRIPCSTKMVPKSVANKTLKHIAFYHTKTFNKDAYCVRWYSEVKNISVVPRKVLLPKIQNDPKANDEYYKIEFNSLSELSTPIISNRPRRVLFVPTTLWHFQNASNINDLFYESPLEEEFWEALKTAKIESERQFLIYTDMKMFYLDFALFCKERNINIECDGDRFHLSEFNVKRDKNRNNILSSLGWSILRFTTEDIKRNLNTTIQYVKETINQYGGIEIISEKTYRYFEEDQNQISLFDY